MIMPLLIINIYVSLIYELKKMERYWRVNLLGPGPRLMKKEFTGPRSHRGWQKLFQIYFDSERELRPRFKRTLA